MKHSFLLLAILTAVFIGLPARAAVKSLTLDDAIRMALGENLQIRAAEREVDASEARYRRSGSNFLPRLGAESRYEFFDSPYQRQNGATANLFFEWNVYNGFRDWYDRKAKSFDLSQTRILSEKQRIFVRTDVEAAFHRLLAMVESIRAYDEALQRNERQKESARKRRAAGLGTDADILEFDLYHTELKAEATKLDGQLKQAQAGLRELLGERDRDTEYLPQGKLIHFHVDESLDALKVRLEKESQTLIGARYAVDQAEANKKVSLGGYLPQLSVRATYGSRGINETQVAPETAIVGTARWELFSGFDTRFAQTEAAALAAKADASLHQTELAMTAQVESAYALLKAVQDRVDLETENRAKAGRFFDAVAAEYRRGVKNSTDMRSASQTLLQVVLRDIQNRAEFFEQKALLEKALGGAIKISRGSLSGHTD